MLQHDHHRAAIAGLLVALGPVTIAIGLVEGPLLWTAVGGGAITIAVATYQDGD